MDEWEVDRVSMWKSVGEDAGTGYGVSVSLELPFADDAPPILHLGQAVQFGLTTFTLDELFLARRDRTWVARLSADGLPFGEAEAFLNGWMRERV